MRGAKPRLMPIQNVVPLREEDERLLDSNIQKKVKALQPSGLSPEMEKEWKRVATILADPRVDRLKARHVDVILEYCYLSVRIRKLRATMPTIESETYKVTGRNGDQLKSKPQLGQLNEAWRQWRTMLMALGLSPMDERNMEVGTGEGTDITDRYFK